MNYLIKQLMALDILVENLNLKNLFEIKLFWTKIS